MNTNQELRDTSETFKYFYKAELQYENDYQKQEIITAINDMLNLESEVLKQKKYCNYMQEPNKWTITELVYKYFVPDSEDKVLGDNFFSEIKNDDIREVLKEYLNELKQ